MIKNFELGSKYSLSYKVESNTYPTTQIILINDPMSNKTTRPVKVKPSNKLQISSFSPLLHLIDNWFKESNM